jgi:hypothetical protein
VKRQQDDEPAAPPPRKRAVSVPKRVLISKATGCQANPPPASSPAAVKAKVPCRFKAKPGEKTKRAKKEPLESIDENAEGDKWQVSVSAARKRTYLKREIATNAVNKNKIWTDDNGNKRMTRLALAGLESLRCKIDEEFDDEDLTDMDLQELADVAQGTVDDFLLDCSDPLLLTTIIVPKEEFQEDPPTPLMKEVAKAIEEEPWKKCIVLEPNQAEPGVIRIDPAISADLEKKAEDWKQQVEEGSARLAKTADSKGLLKGLLRPKHDPVHTKNAQEAKLRISARNEAMGKGKNKIVEPVPSTPADVRYDPDTGEEITEWWKTNDDVFEAAATVNIGPEEGKVEPTQEAEEEFTAADLPDFDEVHQPPNTSGCFTLPGSEGKPEHRCATEGCPRESWGLKWNQKCCRTCKQTGGTSHGPVCEEKYQFQIRAPYVTGPAHDRRAVFLPCHSFGGKGGGTPKGTGGSSSSKS